MKKIVLGIDAGGTKTDIIVSDLEGNLITKIPGKPASLRNIGVEKSCQNIIESLQEVDGKAVYAFVGFPAFYEEYSDCKAKIKSLLSSIADKVEVGSDQLVAFRAGTDEKKGIVVISGTGSVVRGFSGKNAKASGWGYFADEGSAFWAGIEAYRAITKSLDHRSPRTMMKDMIFEKWAIDSQNEFNKKIYEDPITTIPLLSVIVDYADRRNDPAAGKIIEKAAEEIFQGVKTVINQMNLSQSKFPLVVVGGMFKSNRMKKIFCEKVGLSFPRADIIFPKNDPVMGAVKLAIKNYHAKR